MANGLMAPQDVVSYRPDPSDWLRQVLSGQFLSGSPHLDQLIQQIEADSQRQFSQAMLPAETARLQQSGAYGTALGDMSRSRTAGDFAQGLMGQTAGLRHQDYGQERDRMMQALGLYTGQEDAVRGLLAQMRMGTEAAQTGLEQSRIGAGATIGAANAAAGASRYGADRQFAAAQLGHQANYWNNLLNWANNFSQNYQTGGNVPGGWGMPSQTGPPPTGFNPGFSMPDMNSPDPWNMPARAF